MALVIILLCGAGCRESGGSLNEKAIKAFMADDREEAARLFKRALTVDPDNYKAHFYLGWIYRMEGKTDEAIVEFKKAIATNPDDALANQNIGDLYLAKGMLVEAIAAFKRAIAIDPDSGMAFYGLGMAYKQQGALAEAADALFEAGLLAVVRNNKDLALNACNTLKETGNQQLAVELQGVLSSWFDPANEAVKPPE